ncbi:MAG TPA: hypothetical protein VGD54_11625 [Steroidobacteraceae bacterium]
MNTLKPFDPNEIDETLTRVVSHGRDTYLMFPYINATGPAPQFNSISYVIEGSAATIEDFLALSALVRQAGENAKWLISFSTPWLMRLPEAVAIEQRPRQGRTERQ